MSRKGLPKLDDPTELNEGYTFQGQEIRKRKNLQRIMTLQIKP